MRGFFLKGLIGFAVLLGGLAAHAEFEVPALTAPVIDQVGYMTTSDRAELTRLLRDFNSRGKAQLTVLIVKSLEGMPIEQASIMITDKWRLGDATKDNGVLFLISAQDRAMRIEVGQGLEGAIPDVYAKRIIQDQVIPFFKQKRFSEGIVQGAYSILNLADQEFADEKKLESREASEKGGIPIFVLIILFVIISVLGRFGGGRGRYYHGGYGGGGFGGSGGGGGWSGGGGGFSGGGASGNW